MENPTYSTETKKYSFKDKYDKFYTSSQAKVVHVVPLNGNLFDPKYRRSLCGITRSAHSMFKDNVWLGTGTQQEEDKANQLNLCNNCIKYMTDKEIKEFNNE
jgi:hypothetical protein